MNKTFITLAFILLIIYCLKNKKESKNKKQVGGFYDYFLVYYLPALEDEYINSKPSSMYHLMNNLPPIEQKSIVFFNTIKVLIEGNVNVKGSRFIGNNKKEKINKISSNLKYIRSHINLVNEVYTLKRDRKGLDYYEHKETLERINTYPFIKLENNTILKFQTGENLKDYIIALENEYIPHSRSPPHSMLKYLSLYKNLNNNTLNSFNHIKLLIETSTNQQSMTIDIIRIIKNKEGGKISDMVLKKLDKWLMESPDFPGYMIEIINTEKKPIDIKKIEKYMSRKDIVNKLENKEPPPHPPDEAEAPQYDEPREAPNEAEAPQYDEPREAPNEAEAPQYSESIKSSKSKTASSPEIDFEKQYYSLKEQNYSLKEQNEELEGNYEQLEGSHQKLEIDLLDTRQQLKKNRGKLESFRVMEDFDQNRDRLISRPELEDIFTGNAQKKGGSLDKYYKLL